MSEAPPESLLWDLLRGAVATRALGIVAELGVGNALASGPRPVAGLAEEVGADPDTLHRILRALASDGVFAEETPGVFRHTPASEALGRDGWDDFARLFGGVWHRTVGALEATTQDAVFPELFGTDFWSWLADHPAQRAIFDRSMEQGWERRVERLAALEWRGDELVVDVGGGNGSLLVELLRRHDGLRGIVFDLPETSHDEAELGDRIEFVSGDFFESVPKGDVYVLSTILHDWDDKRATEILRTIRTAAPDGARLLLIEAVLTPGNEPHGGKWLDLLLLPLLGGRERDAGEWRTLLSNAGFESIQIGDGLIECRSL